MLFERLMNKSAQGMSINTIILIVLGLIILVVFAFVLGGKFTDFGRTASQCDGRCVASISECRSSNGAPIPMNNCKEDSGVGIEGEGFCCKFLT